MNAEGLLGDLAIGGLSPIKGSPEEGEALPAVLPVVRRGREGGRKESVDAEALKWRTHHRYLSKYL